MEIIISLHNIWYNLDLFCVALDRAIKWQGCKSKMTHIAFKASQALEEKNAAITKLFRNIMLILS